MSLLNDYIEKVAASNFDSDKELELIKRAQSGDKLAYKQLAKMFSGAIESGISKSGVNLPNVSKETLRMKAMGEFRRSIETYDPGAGAKPASYIIGNIALDLKKLDWKYKNPSRISDDLTRKAGNISSATKQLQADGIADPSDDDISRMIQKNFEKDILPEEIAKIRKRQRKELSGDKIIGAPEEAEELNFGDLNNVDSVTGEDYFQAANDKDKVKELLANLDDRSRAIFSQAEGIGEFEGAGPGKYSEVAKANGLNSDYFAKKEHEKIRKQLESQLKIDS